MLVASCLLSTVASGANAARGGKAQLEENESGDPTRKNTWPRHSICYEAQRLVAGDRHPTDQVERALKLLRLDHEGQVTRDGGDRHRREQCRVRRCVVVDSGVIGVVVGRGIGLVVVGGRHLGERRARRGLRVVRGTRPAGS